MDNEINHLIDNFSRIKPRVNSAPEVLMVDLKRPHRKKPKPRLMNIDNDTKLSNNSLAMNRIPGLPMGNKTMNGSDNYLNISRNISLVSGKRLSVLEQNKEKFEIQFCRINVLLISMQLGLGFSMSGLGVYLRSVSPSLSWRDCSYWAGVPLLFSGAFGLYFCLSDFEIYRRSYISQIVKIICTSLSLVSAGLTLTASVMSGSHGKWISDFSSTCDEHFINEHSEVREYPEKCCLDNIIDKHQVALANETRCICKTAPNGNFSLLKFEKEYVAVTCRYVFSALKDYFILQSSLMGVATGVCIWIVILHMKKNHNHSSSDHVPHRRDEYPTAKSESPSPSFLRFFPCQHNPNQVSLSKWSSPAPRDLQVPRVMVHDIFDDNNSTPFRFY